MKALDFDLPYGVSANAAYVRTMRGIALSKTGRAYRAEVGRIIKELGIDKNVDCRLELTVELYCPDKRRRDIDNLIKPLLDALEAANVFVNDEQFDSIHITRAGYEKPGRMRVTIKERVEFDSLNWALQNCS